MLSACVGLPLIMVRPSVHEEALFIAFHRSETRVDWNAAVFCYATATVQLAKFLQYAEPGPPSADSKNGCAARLPALWPLKNMALYTDENACAKLCPFRVVMYGTASSPSS